MHDINLFDRFKPEPKKTNYLGLLMFLLFAILIAFIVYSEFNFYSEKNKLEHEIEELRAFSNSQEVKDKLQEIEEKQRLSQDLSAMLTKLVFVDVFMDLSNVVYDGLLTSISTSVPENCFLKNVKISVASVNLDGYADSYESVAEFEHRLRLTGKLYTLFNPTISEENANYAFSFVAKVFEGGQVENQ